MNVYTVTYVDGTQVKINADTSDEAVRNAQALEKKAVDSFSNDRNVEEKPKGAFEDLQHGGANL